MWTLDELVERVRSALAEVEYPGAPNGRVREVPDRRAVRWYTTTGLVDRPAALRGRIALYGPRHLLQLVAVKRRQAEGRSLAEIQAELAGATDSTLAGIARVPDDLLTVAGDAAVTGPVRPRFWTAAPGPAPATLPEAAPAAVPAGPEADSVATETTLAGVPLGRGALLLLPAHPAPDDLPAINAAAAPLLDLLADRGLLTGPGPGPRRAARSGNPFVDIDPLAEQDARADRGPRTQRSSS
jgi:DNA-binding transcriptional MerR regulator